MYTNVNLENGHMNRKWRRLVNIHEAHSAHLEVIFQEKYNTPRYRTPNRQSPGNANYERNPIIACW